MQESTVADQPDHLAIVAKVAVVEERTNTILARLDKQDAALEELKAARNVEIGRSMIVKMIGGTIVGGAGAGLVKLVDWLQGSGVHPGHN